MKLKFFASVFIVIALAVLVAPQYMRAQSMPRRIEIVAKRFDFTPNEISLKRGTPVVFVLTSKDVAHGLKFKGLNLTIKTKKGGTNEVTFTPTEVGTFVGQCAVFCGSGHGLMKITLHVTE